MTGGLPHVAASLNSLLLTCLIIVTGGLVRQGRGLTVYAGDDCLDLCPTTNHYSPVCGTDYVTYLNMATLLCWKRCSVPDLGVAHFSTCVDWITGNFKL